VTAVPALLLFLLAAPALSLGQSADPESDPAPEEPPASFHLRVRGQHWAGSSDFSDIGHRRVSIWTDTQVADRWQLRAVWDHTDQRIHDLWLQYRIVEGLEIRVGRSAPPWLPEFTDPPHAWQRTRNAIGSAPTRVRETGVFLFAERGAYHARLHLVAGTGFEPEDNSWNDLVASAGRTYGAWTVDVGHYEGRDGPEDALTPRRQPGFHLDGDLGRERFVRGAAYHLEQYGERRFGGFLRYRNRFWNRAWALAEIGGESNRGVGAGPDHASYFILGGRYELPWTQTHLSADYRFRFGAVSERELVVLLSWVFDLRERYRP